jgi:hypothetical protein
MLIGFYVDGKAIVLVVGFTDGAAGPKANNDVGLFRYLQLSRDREMFDVWCTRSVGGFNRESPR